MKLAEALILRADLQKNIGQLKGRLKDSAKVQEGDTPAEEMDSLFDELNKSLAQLEELIYRINVTNMQTIHEGESLTRMMARKDVLTTRLSVLRELVQHVAGSDTRYSRNEIKYVRTIDMAELRKTINEYSKKLRELDIQIQGLNWTVDLI